MPAVVAVQLTDDAMVLHLDTAMELDDPWECDDSAGLRWRLAHDTALGDVGAADEGQPAPYPLLVTSGTSDNGDLWLLNFERLATVRVTGDTTFGHDFLRYLAAELAVNPWSRDAKITCVGVASEVQPMNPERFSPTTSIERASADVLADAVATLTRARQAGTDTATARSGQFADEAWGARLMIIDAESAQNQTLRRLVVIVEAQPTMTATAVVVGGETDAVSGPELRFSPQGRVTLTHIGLDLVAVGLTSDEARGCAALLEHSELAGDTPMPTTANAEDGWRSLSDDAGALRDELTVPRTVPDHDLIEPASSLLDTDDTALPPVATDEDLAELDPKVPAHVRAEVEQADPTLDVDVMDWFSSQCDRPRLALLGPVSVRAHGAPIAKRKPYYTEVLAYIALRENGATSDEISDAFGHSASTTRSSVKKVRDWLGINPRTGEWHLPEATRSKAAQQRGVPVYQVEDLLVDVDLFRRLRLRGQARGVEGISDLVTVAAPGQRTPIRPDPSGRMVLAGRHEHRQPHDLCHRRRRPHPVHPLPPEGRTGESAGRHRNGTAGRTFRHHPQARSGRRHQSRRAPGRSPPDRARPRVQRARRKRCPDGSRGTRRRDPGQPRLARRPRVLTNNRRQNGQLPQAPALPPVATPSAPASVACSTTGRSPWPAPVVR